MKCKFELVNKGNGTYSVYWQNLNTGELKAKKEAEKAVKGLTNS